MFLTFNNSKEYQQAKVEFNQLLGFLKSDIMDAGFQSIVKITNQLNENKDLTLEATVIFPSEIDFRKIKSNYPKSKVGLNFDSNPSVILLTYRYGNEHPLELDNEMIDEIIKELKSLKVKK